MSAPLCSPLGSNQREAAAVGATFLSSNMFMEGFTRRDLRPEMWISNHPREGAVEGPDLLLFLQVKQSFRQEEGFPLPRRLLLGEGRTK